MFTLALLLAAGTADLAPATAAPTEAVVPAPYVVGTDTIDTIRAKVGKPNTVQTISDGSTIMVYVSTSAKVKGASYIPIVGLFAGGAKGRYSIKSFTFDAKGVLATFSISDTQTDCNVGLGGGGCH